MKPKIYATQGGGYAQIIGDSAYFVERLDKPGAYVFEIGEKVPDQWDLIPYNNYYKDKNK